MLPIKYIIWINVIRNMIPNYRFEIIVIIIWNGGGIDFINNNCLSRKLYKLYKYKYSIYNIYISNITVFLHNGCEYIVVIIFYSFMYSYYTYILYKKFFRNVYFSIYIEIKFKFYYWWNKNKIYLYFYNKKTKKFL